MHAINWRKEVKILRFIAAAYEHLASTLLPKKLQIHFKKSELMFQLHNPQSSKNFGAY